MLSKANDTVVIEVFVKNNIEKFMLLKLDNKCDRKDFNFQPKKQILNNLAESMKVLEFNRVNFSGHVAQNELSQWHLSASLKFHVIQECVVTLEPVTSFIKSKVERVYIDNSSKSIESKPSEIEYEKFEETLNLMDILFEEISLNTPEYPKIKNINKFRENNEKQINYIKGDLDNPFLILKNFSSNNKMRRG